MLFQCELTAIALSTAFTIPSVDFLRGREIDFSADKSFLSVMHSPHMDCQVAFLSETSVTSGNRTWENLSLFEANVAVYDLEVTTELS